MDQWTLSRREFLRLSAFAALACTAVGQTQASAAATAAPSPPRVKTTFKVNGKTRALAVDPRVTLLDALRDHVGLIGTKKGCDHGQCGACTVLVNGRRVNSCLTLAVMQNGAEVVTIEGLGTPEHLHKMQAAFLEHDGFQCGYCTPGQICSAVGMVAELRRGVPSAVTQGARVTLSDEEIRERMSGNICRCGAYANIVAAVRAGGAA